MACTAQSALAYVESARVHLVGELKNLSVIVENLYQQGVFTDEEVSEIQAEKHDYNKTRHILNSVIKKGEKACYKFLKIIDTTRKRTLERPTPLPERNTEPVFDLHYWISCFSFKEDPQTDVEYFQGSRPCHEYQRKLKIKTRNISSEFWTANKRLFGGNNKPDLSYTPLVLDTQESVSPYKIKKSKNKKSRMSRPKKMKKYLPVDRPEISPSELLKTDKNILLVGQPGIGKTALAHEMLKLWAERDNRDLDYMFYFDMRNTLITSTMSLEDLLFGVFSEPDRGKEEVLQNIKENSDNVTVIFDGLTDLSSSVVRRLVEKDLLPYAKVIVTCRPDDEEDFLSGNFLKMEVNGFSEQTIKTYLSAMLGDEHNKVLSNLELFTLCHVPMYALMVAACFSEDSPQPCTITEIYINIVRSCLQMNSNKTRNKDLNSFITNKCEEILRLAEVAFHATEGKTVNLPEMPCEDSCVLSFLKPLFIKAALTETITTYAFLHYTMQEFFAALWLLKNPDKISDVLQQCLTEEKKHMKHVIPFMCRLLSEKSPCLMKCLISARELKNTSKWFFKEMINTFFAHAEDSGLDVDILFLCQCLYESQCPEACVYLLDKLDYRLDLSGESLDPNLCCAVAYVVTQSKERKISLNLEDVMLSEQGMRRLSGCLQNVQWRDPLPRQLWEIFLLSEGQMDDIGLLGLDGNQLHLPVEGDRRLFERAVNVMQKVTKKVHVCLHWERETPACQRLCECLLEALPSISSISFRVTYRGPGYQDQEQRQRTLGKEEKQLLLDLCLRAALHKAESFHSIVHTLLSFFSVNLDLKNFLLDLYQHVKNKGFSDIIPKLEPLFQSAPAVWFIDLSERKTSILLEVLKLQSEKKQVKLTGCSHEESEVRSLLQCLPYISQLSFSRRFEGQVEFIVNLFCAAAEREQQTGEKIVKLLSSVCTYQTFPLNGNYQKHQSDFLLDLFSHVKDYETKTGLSVLPSLQSVFQSAPAVWSIDLSERKTSILLEVLKLQSEKKQVELTGCSHEESEVRSLLQCLPYISQLSFSRRFEGQVEFIVNLFCAAAEREQQTGEKTVKLLSSVCTYQTFPLNEEYIDDDDDDIKKYQSDFLLDLFSHVKDYETKTGLSVLPSLQSVFQSAPAVWSIDLSERKTSILLEVLKLQSEKKQVQLTDCSHEESEVRSLLQCLPYISRLSCDEDFFQTVCACISVRSREEAEQLSSLLKLLGFTLLLTGQLSRKACRLSADMALLLFRWVRRGRVSGSLAIEELSLGPQTVRASERGLSKVVSSLASLLRLSEITFQELLSLLYEIQDEVLTRSFLSKVGGDLSSCCLNWELLHYLLQQSPAQTITVNLRRNRFLQENITRLRPFLDRIVFKRLCPSFVLAVIREIYKARDSLIIPGLLRSLDHVISLTCREMDSEDCAALIFTLKHSDRVRLNLLWTSIPAGETESILLTLDKVSQLSVDRNLLLRFVHCCAASEVQQGAAVNLLRAVQHRLDLSCSSHVELPQEGQSETLSLTAEDCRAVSTILRRSSRKTQLDLQDCEVEDSGLDLLLPVPDRVRLRASKAVLLQLVSLVPVSRERDAVRRAVSLCRALGGELDLSHTTLDQRTCAGLAQMLDFSEVLTELDLSHCELTDQLLLTLITHLHKVQVLDLSHNKITDASADMLLQLVSINPSIHSVRLLNNNIVDRKPFERDRQFEIW
ncbi:Protein NLRC5 [Collichthys lucidus]|uniref:Protein NLRC5 n=1 Tax=Collichthys lucidus TaxID=240159 RepID=A0A4U5TYA5_COLLU|nr:Protein NLRC5 [Collichthys lucidus]